MPKRPSKPDDSKKPAKAPRGYPPADRPRDSRTDHDDDGTFTVGNAGGRGGRREGAGRKTSEAKEVWEKTLDRLDELATARLTEILSGEVKPNTMPDGSPVEGEFVLVVDDRVVMDAIKHVQNHRHGKPTVRLKMDGGDDELLDTINRAKAARIAQLGKAHQRAAKALAPPPGRNKP